MYNQTLLELSIRSFYREAIMEDGYTEEAVEEMLDEIDFYALTQAVRHDAQTVYAYLTQGKQEKSFDYRGHELFDQRATLLYSDFDADSNVTVSCYHSYELWLLEDMSLAVVACVELDFDDGTFWTEYREINGTVPWASPMYIDLEGLTESLKEMCEDVYECKQPVYEL